MFKYILSFFKSPSVDNFFKNETLKTILMQILMHSTNKDQIRNIFNYFSTLDKLTYDINLRLGYSNGAYNHLNVSTLHGLDFYHQRYRELFETLKKQSDELITYTELAQHVDLVTNQTKTSLTYLCIYMTEIIQAHCLDNYPQTEIKAVNNLLAVNMKKILTDKDLNLELSLEVLNKHSNYPNMTQDLVTIIAYWKNEIEQLKLVSDNTTLLLPSLA